MVLHRKIFHLTLKKLYCRLFVLSECFNTWQAVESSKSVWGKISMVDAEKRLLGHALEDPDTQHFVIFLCHFLHAEASPECYIEDTWMQVGGTNCFSFSFPFLSLSPSPSPKIIPLIFAFSLCEIRSLMLTDL